MNNNISELIAALIVLVLLMCGGVLLGSNEEKKDIAVWNDGYHENCGGTWEYEQAVGHRYSTHYIYICDKCGMRYEFNDLR